VFVAEMQDYLFQYRSAIEAVTPADVLAAAQRHLHPDSQTTVVIADARRVKKGLEAANGSRPVQMLALEE